MLDEKINHLQFQLTLARSQQRVAKESQRARYDETIEELGRELAVALDAKSQAVEAAPAKEVDELMADFRRLREQQSELGKAIDAAMTHAEDLIKRLTVNEIHNLMKAAYANADAVARRNAQNTRKD